MALQRPINKTICYTEEIVQCVEMHIKHWIDQLDQRLHHEQNATADHIDDHQVPTSSSEPEPEPTSSTAATAAAAAAVRHRLPQFAPPPEAIEEYLLEQERLKEIAIWREEISKARSVNSFIEPSKWMKANGPNAQRIANCEMRYYRTKDYKKPNHIPQSQHAVREERTTRLQKIQRWIIKRMLCVH